MTPIARATWIARFDMEDLISVILRSGMLIGMGLVMAGLTLQVIGAGRGGLEARLQGTNVLQFMLADLPRVGSPLLWPALLAHLGVAVVLLTPYARIVASLYYFAYVERRWTHALLTSLTLIALTYILFLG